MSVICCRHYKFTSLVFTALSLALFIILLNRNTRNADVTTSRHEHVHHTWNDDVTASDDASNKDAEDHEYMKEVEKDPYDVMDIVDAVQMQTPADGDVTNNLVDKPVDHEEHDVRERSVVDWWFNRNNDEDNSTSSTDGNFTTFVDQLMESNMTSLVTSQEGDSAAPSGDSKWNWINKLLEKIMTRTDVTMSDEMGNITEIETLETETTATPEVITDLPLNDSDFNPTSFEELLPTSVSLEDSNSTSDYVSTSPQYFSTVSRWSNSCPVTSGQNDVCDEVMLSQSVDLLFDESVVDELVSECGTDGGWCLRQRQLTPLSATQLLPYCQLTEHCQLAPNNQQQQQQQQQEEEEEDKQCKWLQFVLDTLDLLCAVTTDSNVTSRCVMSLRMMAHVSLAALITENSTLALTVNDMTCVICEDCSDIRTNIESFVPWRAMLDSVGETCNTAVTNDSSIDCTQFHLLQYDSDVIGIFHDGHTALDGVLWRPEMTSVCILLLCMLVTGLAIIVVAYCADWRKKELGREMDRCNRNRIEYSVISTDDLDDSDDDDDDDGFSLGLGPITTKSRGGT